MNGTIAKICTILRPPPPITFFVAALFWYLAYIAYHKWGFALISPYPFSDAELYDHYAWYKAFIESSGGELGKIIPPSAYIIFLELSYKLTGPQIITPFLYNAVALAAGCVFIVQLSHKMFGMITGYTAGVLFMLCGPILFYVGLSMKSASVILFLCASLYFLYEAIVRPSVRNYVAFSLFLGLLCIDRNNFLLSLLFIPFLAFKNTHTKKSLVFSLLMLYLPAMGIIATVNSLQSHANPTSPLGINFYIGNSAKATGAYTNLDNIHDNLIGHHIDMIRATEDNSVKLPGKVDTQIYWIRKALEEHTDNPFGLIKLELKKFLMLFARDVPGSPEQYALWRWHDPLLRIALADYGVLLALALPAMLLVWRKPEHRNKRAHILIPLVYAILLVPFFITERYRLPVLVSLIPFAAYTLTTIASKGRSLKERAGIASICIAIYALSILLVSVVSYGPGWPKDPQGKREFEVTSNKHRQEIYRIKRQAVMKNDRYAWQILHDIYAVTALKEDAEEFRRRARGTQQ